MHYLHRFQCLVVHNIDSLNVGPLEPKVHHPWAIPFTRDYGTYVQEVIRRRRKEYIVSNCQIAIQFYITLDVAISAPFTETGNTEPGTVFIYHSAPTLLLTSEPRQVSVYRWQEL